MTLAITPDTPVFDQKDPEESVYIIFDFTNDMGAGESLDQVLTITAEVHEGSDPSPSGILDGLGGQVVSQPIVAQKVSGGVALTDYRLQAKISTTGGAYGARTLVLAGILPVREV